MTVRPTTRLGSTEYVGGLSTAEVFHQWQLAAACTNLQPTGGKPPACSVETGSKLQHSKPYRKFSTSIRSLPSRSSWVYRMRRSSGDTENPHCSVFGMVAN